MVKCYILHTLLFILLLFLRSWQECGIRMSMFANEPMATAHSQLRL